MAAQRHEIFLSAPYELSYDEFKVTKCCTKKFCLC